MPPKHMVQVPAIALSKGLPISNTCEQAAEHAAATLMDSPVIDWLGKVRTLRNITDQAGISHEVEFATRQLFLALVTEGVSYRDYRDRVKRNPLSVSEDAKRAVHYYHHVFARSPDLQSMRLGDGALLLARINLAIEQQIQRDQSQTPSLAQ